MLGEATDHRGQSGPPPTESFVARVDGPGAAIRPATGWLDPREGDQVNDPESAERARESNNAQIMARGGRTIAPEVANQPTDHWLDSEFEAGRSALKVPEVDDVDTRHRGEREPARSSGS